MTHPTPPARGSGRCAKSNGFPEPLVDTMAEGIEVDVHWPTASWSSTSTARSPAQADAREDALRDRILSAAGDTVLRFTEEELERRPAAVINRLRAGAFAPAL